VDTHPKIELALDVGFWSRNAVSEMPDIRVEIDDTTARLHEVWVPLGYMHYVLFASKSYVEKFGMPATMAQTADHRLIGHAAQIFQRETWGKRQTALGLLATPGLFTSSRSHTHK